MMSYMGHHTHCVVLTNTNKMIIPIKLIHIYEVMMVMFFQRALSAERQVEALREELATAQTALQV